MFQSTIFQKCRNDLLAVLLGLSSAEQRLKGLAQRHNIVIVPHYADPHYALCRVLVGK